MFREHFDFKLPAIVNFVGGGGKTGAILALLGEYAQDVPVVYTTTTRIHPPHPSHGQANLGCEDVLFLKHLCDRIGSAPRERPLPLVLTRGTLRPGLLRGLPPDFGPMIDLELFPLVLNEADGARSMSLKVPREGEPVLMQGASYLVPVIGLDCLRKPLGPDSLFRWELAAKQFGLRAGEIITPEVAARILLHPQGVCKGWSTGVEIVPFVNKADGPESDSEAQALADALMAGRDFAVRRVVWGSLQAGRAASISLPDP